MKIDAYSGWAGFMGMLVFAIGFLSLGLLMDIISSSGDLFIMLTPFGCIMGWTIGFTNAQYQTSENEE